MVLDGFLLQKGELPLQRLLPIYAEIPLMSDRIRIQLSYILVATRRMRDIEGRPGRAHITIERLRHGHQILKFGQQLSILKQHLSRFEI
ncbi:hypothetical protein D3C72_2298890 [compost metagenome]